LPGMMPFEDVQVQLVDLPPVHPDFPESWLYQIIRNADAALLVVDLSAADVLDQIEEVITTLEHSKLKLTREAVESEPSASVASKQCRLVGTKLDLSASRANREVLEDLYGERFGFSAVSGETGENVEPLRGAIFRMLRLVRVYTKPPHEPADMRKPFVLQEGNTLRDFASAVHHDFAERLKFARVWGHGKFEGQRINRDYRLRDRDVIELHL